MPKSKQESDLTDGMASLTVSSPSKPASSNPFARKPLPKSKDRAAPERSSLRSSGTAATSSATTATTGTTSSTTTTTSTSLRPTFQFPSQEWNRSSSEYETPKTELLPPKSRAKFSTGEDELDTEDEAILDEVDRKRAMSKLAKAKEVKRKQDEGKFRGGKKVGK